MKIFIRAFMLIVCAFILNSFVSAATVYPSFYFEFKDGSIPPPTYTYDVYYRIQNSGGTFFPSPGFWGAFTGYSQGVNYLLTDGARTVNPPAPPYPLRCYRIEVLVVRSDGEYRGGWSSWTDEAGLQNGSLQVNVNAF